MYPEAKYHPHCSPQIGTATDLPSHALFRSDITYMRHRDRLVLSVNGSRRIMEHYGYDLTVHDHYVFQFLKDAGYLANYTQLTDHPTSYRITMGTIQAERMMMDTCRYLGGGDVIESNAKRMGHRDYITRIKTSITTGFENLYIGEDARILVAARDGALQRYRVSSDANRSLLDMYYHASDTSLMIADKPLPDAFVDAGCYFGKRNNVHLKWGEHNVNGLDVLPLNVYLGIATGIEVNYESMIENIETHRIFILRNYELRIL